MVEVIQSEEFGIWFAELSDKEAKSVAVVITMLEQAGLTLGHPYSSAINGTDYPIRELRPKRGRSDLRPFYAFAPDRKAVLLIGGRKSDRDLYDGKVREAERIFDEYKASLSEE